MFHFVRNEWDLAEMMIPTALNHLFCFSVMSLNSNILNLLKKSADNIDKNATEKLKNPQPAKEVKQKVARKPKSTKKSVPKEKKEKTPKAAKATAKTNTRGKKKEPKKEKKVDETPFEEKTWHLDKVTK